MSKWEQEQAQAKEITCQQVPSGLEDLGGGSLTLWPNCSCECLSKGLAAAPDYPGS